jgi:hypothetical protein
MRPDVLSVVSFRDRRYMLSNFGRTPNIRA